MRRTLLLLCSSPETTLPPPAPCPPRSSPSWPQVRDQLTTTNEQELLRAGGQTSPTLSREAVMVDAIVNTGEGTQTALS